MWNRSSHVVKLYASPVVVMDLAGYQILGAENLKEA